MNRKNGKEYPKDPRHIDEILWQLLLKENDVFDEFLYDGEGKIYMKKRSEWLVQWFKDLKSKLIEPNFSYEPQKETPAPAEKAEPKSGITGKKRNYY